MATVKLRYTVEVYNEKEFEVPDEIVETIHKVDDEYNKNWDLRNDNPEMFRELCERRAAALDRLEDYVNLDEFLANYEGDYDYIDFISVDDAEGYELMDW